MVDALRRQKAWKRARRSRQSQGILRVATLVIAAARIRFDKRKSLVTFPAGQARVVVNPFTPTPNGAHPIQIPDFPHPLAARYVGRSAYAMSWFHLGRGDAIRGSTGQDRYLHCGSASLGCITVEPADWTALYQYLILCRSGDGRTVGTAIVD